MDQQEDRIERRLNIDFVMSVCALLISALACATAFYQLRNASLMMSAQTWPYVTAGWHYDNDEAGILVTNDGQGLAIVHAAILKEGILQVDALVNGIVIRPGQTLRLLMVRGANWDTQLLAARKRISVALCYCSVLERCWTNNARWPATRGRALRRCREPGVAGSRRRKLIAAASRAAAGSHRAVCGRCAAHFRYPIILAITA